MKAKNYLLTLFLLSFVVLYGQKSDNSIPSSLTYNLNDEIELEPSKKVLPSLDLTILQTEDEIDKQNGLPPRFGLPIDVNYEITNSGIWTTLPSGDRIWRLKIYCENAVSINLLYDRFWLPQGAKFHIYKEDKSQIIGGFSSANNRGTQQNPSKFTTGLLLGDSIILELFEPIEVKDLSIISIDKVVHGYIELAQLLNVGWGTSGSCQVNVNCEEGNNWQNEKKGVALILVNGSRLCTGSLVNNTTENYKPYFLTADHCIGSLDASSNTDASHYSFYWNYESSNCSSSSDYTPQSTSGATLRANNSTSDFALFELTESPVDNNIEVYFNGWDRTINPIQGGVGIHHPSGDFKKIATHNMNPIDGQVYDANTHWRVNWIETQNGYSVTEGGSSGSPLFTSEKKIIGQLHGGSPVDCFDPANDPGEYGKFYVSWDGANPQRRLRDWLDPSNTNQASLNGLFGCDSSVSDIIIFGPDELPYGQQATYHTNYPNVHWSTGYGFTIISLDTSGYEITMEATGAFWSTITASISDECMKTTKIITIYEQQEIVPYPNSSDTSFSLDFTTYPPNTVFYIYIYDQYQNEVYSGESINVEKTISTVNLSSNTYYLHVYVNGELTAKQLLVQH